MQPAKAEIARTSINGDHHLDGTIKPGRERYNGTVAVRKDEVAK
jgi:hypothetical protein